LTKKIGYSGKIKWKEQYINYPWIIKILSTSANGLLKDSSIECFQIKNFAVDRFDKKIGEINEALLIQVHSTIAKTFNPTYKIN